MIVKCFLLIEILMAKERAKCHLCADFKNKRDYDLSGFKNRAHDVNVNE